MPFDFLKRRTKICVFVKTHIAHKQLKQVRNNWLDCVIISPGDKYTNALLVLPHPGHECSTEVAIDPLKS